MKMIDEIKCIKCINCNRDIIEEKYFCRHCYAKISDDVLEWSMKYKEEREPREIMNKVLDRFEELEKKVEELILWVRNKKQNKTERTRNRLTQKERDFILRRDNYTCKNCLRKLDKKSLHIDHIIPYSKGGTKNPKNLQVLCIECNMLKKEHQFNLKKPSFTREK